mgnify:CR=1 FL=1
MERRSPPFVQEVQKQHPDKKIEVWFQDEARFGQLGSLTRVWAQTGSRPSQIKQTEYTSAYLIGAVNPVSGVSVGLVFSTIDSDIVNIHLQMISEKLKPETHAILIWDNAGFHVAKNLKIPENITLFPLPPYSPELNPVERLWCWIKNRYLSNRIFEGLKHLIEAGCEAWNQLQPDLIKSICHTSWIIHTN